MPDHLLGVAEIATLLGVSRQRVDQLAGTYADFPRPEAELAAGRIWSKAAIEGWLATHPERKPGREVGRGIMFERFTDRARRVVVLAQEEARGLGHNYLGCEHLILGLLREGEGLAGRCLREFGLSVDEARAVISRFVGLGSAKPEGHLAFTPRVAKALEKAGEASLELGHNYIGTEHVLLGVLREGENVGCLLLVEAGLELSRVRLKLLESMRFPQPAVAPDSAPAGALDRVLAQIAEIGERLARIEQRLT